jgi:23S rRNA (uracil1939-C5)-methyltransferase
MIEVDVEKVVYGGDGLARQQGRVLLIPYAAPGDRLRVTIVSEKADFARAEITEIVSPSPERRTAPCPYYGVCGGCQLQHLRYDAQLRAKLAMISESLARIAGLTWRDDIRILPSPEFHYRLRAELKIEVAAKKVMLGYYRPSSHTLCTVTHCPLLGPVLNQALEHLQGYPPEAFTAAQAINLAESQEGWVAIHPPLRSPWREMFAEACDPDAEHTLPSPRPPLLPAIERLPSSGGAGAETLSHTYEGEGMSARLRSKRSVPSRGLVWRAGGYTYRFDVRTFFQANRFLLSDLLAVVVEGEQGERALDLFCGVGFFTLPLAERFAVVVGVDNDPRAIEWARQNAEHQGLSGCRFEVAPVDAWLWAHGHRMGKLDLVVVDPPRTGLTRRTVQALARMRPRRITYVSCNPTTLARDVKWFLQQGYDLTAVTALDLFPQTFHVETVARLCSRPFSDRNLSPPNW